MRELNREEVLGVVGGELVVVGVDPLDRLRDEQQRQLEKFLEQHQRVTPVAR